MFALFALLFVVVAATRRPSTPGAASPDAPAPGASPGTPGGPRTTPPGGIPGSGPVAPTPREPVTETPGSGAPCFTGIPNATPGGDDDLTGLPTEIRAAYIDAVSNRPPAGIGAINRDVVAQVLENLGRCIEVRGFLRGARRLYNRAAEVRSGSQDGPGGPYTTPSNPGVPGLIGPPAGLSPVPLPNPSPPITNIPGLGYTRPTFPVVTPGIATPAFPGFPGGGPGLVPIAPSGPVTSPPGNPIDIIVASIPDVPAGGGVRTQVSRILRLFDTWKADLTSFPYGDPAYLRTLADTIESTYGATQAANRLRAIAMETEAANERSTLADRDARRTARAMREWPGLMAIDDPALQPFARQLAYGLHLTTELVGVEEGEFGQISYPVKVLVPVNGYPVPSREAISAFLTNLSTLYPGSFAPAKDDLQTILAALALGRLRGAYTE